MRRTLVCGLLALLAGLVPAMVEAAAPPFPNKTVTITARHQQIDSVIRDLFGQAGLSVKVTSVAKERMNGTFSGPPERIWAQIARAYNLVAYYDGATVRVYSANEIQSRSYAAAAPDAVVRDLQRMRLTDASNQATAGTGSVNATGVPAFLDRVAQAVASTPAAVNAAATIGPATPSSAAVISPILAPAARETVRSRVLSAASARNPYEVRIFYLRYARADDTIQKSFDRTIVIPGVATVLGGVMGDGRPSSTVSTSGNFDIARLSQPRLLGRGFAAVPPDAQQRDYDDVEPVAQPVVVQGGRERDVNGPRVEVDPTNNAVIVRDRPESMKVYEDIVTALDVEPRGIEIEATILELDVNRLKDLGIDFNLQINGLNLLFGGAQTNPTAGFTPGNLSGTYVTGSNDNFDVRITALEKTGALRVVSKPRLSTLNNIPAVFNNQVQYFVRVAGDRQVDLFPVTSGMVLRVNPSVLQDGGELRTRLAVEVIDGSPTGLIVDGIPAIKQSSINTHAVIKQGESLLIGGMTVDTDYDFKSKVPVLGDAPVLGQLFRKRSKGSQRFERLFLITPRILSQQSVAGRGATPTATPPISIEQLQALSAGRRPKGGSR